MTRKYQVLPQAEFDLLEIAEYIAQHNEQAGLRFLREARKTFQDLAEMPGLGSLVEFSAPAYSNLRTRPVDSFKKYIIFYRSTAEGMEIVRVIHGARDYQAMFQE